MVNEGEKAPHFELEDGDGNKITLSDFAGQKVLLVFYPADNTPVCTSQLCDYRDHWGEFRLRNVQILGINPGSRESHQDFMKKNDFPFPLLSDPKKEVCKIYGATGFLGQIKRKVVLVDENGIVAYDHEEFTGLTRRSARELLEQADRVSGTGNSQD